MHYDQTVRFCSISAIDAPNIPAKRLENCDAPISIIVTPAVPSATNAYLPLKSISAAAPGVSTV